ncbi:hypothetical protein [Streptomyces niger]|uniref:hypothetical protein n=1 Tax=Streptomyces niger TaxID=66373 RepID=UPI00069A49B0|nr:hypothetical protein [Streptomyces niger]
MVKAQHEAHHRAFQEIPQLFRRAFDLLELPDPGDAEVTVLPCDVTEFQPVERRVDTLLHLKCPDGRVYLLIVEAQSKKDPEKALNWAYYLSYLGSRYKKHRPVHHPVLLVVCRDKQTADWAAGPFPLGLPGKPNLLVSPFVLGPDNVPVITDVTRAAADLPLAVFSALTHSADDRIGEILEILATALKKAPDDSTTLYAELTASGLDNSPAAALWRQLMGTRLFDFQNSTTWVAEGFREQGRREARAEVLLRVLEVRDIPLTDDERERIASCQDSERLDLWFGRALIATTTNEVFGEPAEE